MSYGFKLFGRSRERMRKARATMCVMARRGVLERELEERESVLQIVFVEENVRFTPSSLRSSRSPSKMRKNSHVDMCHISCKSFTVKSIGV